MSRDPTNRKEKPDIMEQIPTIPTSKKLMEDLLKDLPEVMSTCAGKTCTETWLDERAFGHRSKAIPQTLRDVIADETPTRTESSLVTELKEIKSEINEYIKTLNAQNRSQGLAMNMLSNIGYKINELINKQN